MSEDIGTVRPLPIPILMLMGFSSLALDRAYQIGMACGKARR
jgi:hypothetical protein